MNYTCDYGFRVFRSRYGRSVFLLRLDSGVGEPAVKCSEISRTDIYSFQGFITLLEDLGDLFRQFLVLALLILGLAEGSLILSRAPERDACLVEFGAFRNLCDDAVDLILVLDQPGQNCMASVFVNVLQPSGRTQPWWTKGQQDA